MQKPFLKWVGGKSQIIDQIIDHMPREIDNYHEPFVGGGSVLLAILSLKMTGDITITGTITATDFNSKLINVYQCVQSHPSELWQCLSRYISTYLQCPKVNTGNRHPSCVEEAVECQESYYYWMRSKFNRVDIFLPKHPSGVSREVHMSQSKQCIESAALFIMLNKTGFRGLYRESKNGFNVPFGNYKNPSILTRDVLMDVSKLIQDVVFKHDDFATVPKLSTNSMVYMDPPYAPEHATSFVGYTKDGFGRHKELFELIDRLSNQGVRVIMSNARVPIVLEHFNVSTKLNYNICEIECRRRINSKNPKATTTEVLITNYDKN
jgi:DNA adenine methylase